MRIVVMSDTHLDRVTPRFEALCARYCDGADLVVHLGDWARSSVLDFMEQYPLEAVLGNMDDHHLRDRLPLKKVVQVLGFRIGIVHGWGAAHDLRAKLRNEFDGVDAILFGHTHTPFIGNEGGVLWFNPGSVFHGRQGTSPSIGILHVETSIRAEIEPLKWDQGN